MVPPDLHAHAPLPPFIPDAPDLPILGGPPEPVETVCPHHLGGTTLLSPSWQDFIFVNPLPEQQSATVLASSKLLDKRLGGVPGDQMQAHHLIPQKFRTHRFVQRAKRAGWDHDQVYNGILLPETLPLSQQHNVPQHRGSHRRYNDQVEQELDILESRARAGNWTDQQAYTVLQQLAAQKEQDIRSTGGGTRVK